MILSRWGRELSYITTAFNTVRCLSNKSSILTRVRRSKYLRLYPTRVVEADGSTYTIRYHEPRRIIKLPLDLSTLTEEERLEILAKRKPKKKIVVQHEEIETFNHNEYLQYLKKKK